MTLKPGDHIIYSKTKRSPKPGRRARAIHADDHGDNYTYVVDKYWTVAKVHPDNTITAVTRRGKRHRLDMNDRSLHKPHFFYDLLHGDRFPSIDPFAAD